VGAHRARLGIATELSPQHRSELSRPADDERLTRVSGGGDLLDERAQHAEADRQSHQRRRDEREARPRAWIASSTPIAARFAIIDEPPTLTNGSGMPVIGAMPIVIPTFTKIWNSKATTMPPATIAEYGSRATATMRSARQSTSRYSASRIDAPTKPRCSLYEAKTKSVPCSGRKLSRVWVAFFGPRPWNWPEPTAAIDCSRL